MKKIFLILLILWAGVSILPAQTTETVIKVDEEGDVGINNENPEKQLDVKGETRIDGDAEITGTAEINSLTVAGVDAAHVPAGIIVMWSGNPGKLPEGWKLCDGSQYYVNAEGVIITTPDLRGRFIAGYHPGDGDYNNVNSDKGGSKSVKLETSHMPSHSHTASVSDPGHSHGITMHQLDYDSGKAGAYTWPNADAGTEDASLNTGGKTTGITVSIGNEGGSQAHENRPPYYVLAFIIKSKTK